MARAQRSVEKEAFWRGILDEQRQSGLNVRTFCRARAISEPSFYAWRRTLAACDVERTADGDGQSKQRLIPVEIVSAKQEHVSAIDVAENKRLEIGTPGGYTLRFAADASSETIARVLDVLARCSAQRAAKGISAC